MYFSPNPANFAHGSHHASMPFTASTPSWPVSSASTTSTTRILTVSAASNPNGTIPTYSWAHTVPTYMPWVPKSENSTLQPVMRFTAPLPPDPCTSQTATSWELLHNLGACSGYPGANQHLKRRSDSPNEDQRPLKQYVSEEKMAARFDQLRISNEHLLPTFSAISSEIDKAKDCHGGSNHHSRPAKTLEELEALLADESSEDSDADEKKSPKGTVVLDPRVKRIVTRDPLISKSILSDMPKPSLALVLWQPPGGIIPRQIHSVTHPPPQFSSIDGSVPLRDAMMMGNAESNNNSNRTVDLNSINSYQSQEHTSSPTHVESSLRRTMESFSSCEPRISEMCDDDDMEL